MVWHLSVPDGGYELAREDFSWDLPDDYNAAFDLVGKHENRESEIALFQAYPDGRRETYTFAELDQITNQLANALADLGVTRGDRVAVMLPQIPENPITHLACWKLGAISMPLSILFGPEGLQYRLEDSSASVAVVDTDRHETITDIRSNCPDLEHVLEVNWSEGDSHADVTPFEELYTGKSPSFSIVDTEPSTPCIIMYTSGSTGPPKGVLHTHSVWTGHLPAFRMYFGLDISDAVCWTPADWAWIGALGDLLFPAWHYGRPVVGYPMGKFDPETAFSLMEEFSVTSAFLPPTAIRMLMNVDSGRYQLALDAICSGGEPLTPEILEWAKTELEGVAVNEIYGQTEANLLVCNCQEWFPARAGSMGKPVPGHEVSIIDGESGEELPPGEVGQIAVRHGDDPIIFEEYWNRPDQTAETRVDDWHLTGDLGERDEDGYIWFKSRDDDLIITSGYRVGPGEVESAILEHPEIEQVGVIGIPDDTRGEIIKAFCQPIDQIDDHDHLREELKTQVSENLAKYEYPREIEFVDELPTTSTGKIKRTELRGSNTA